MKFFAFIAQSLLWLSIAASPTLAGLIVGFLLSSQDGDSQSIIIPLWTIIGFIIGAFWAERIRRTVGLSTFLGRLTGMSEFRDNDKNS